jgi:hypothetical protein
MACRPVRDPQGIHSHGLESPVLIWLSAYQKLLADELKKYHLPILTLEGIDKQYTKHSFFKIFLIKQIGSLMATRKALRYKGRDRKQSWSSLSTPI